MPYRPHAIIETGPIIRGQVFVAAVIGIERLLACLTTVRCMR
jgi:hypothetical protein